MKDQPAVLPGKRTSIDPAPGAPPVQLEAPPIPLFMGDLQMRPHGLNVGISSEGKKVLQFIQGPTAVTVQIESEEIRKAIIKGLTGVEVAG